MSCWRAGSRFVRAVLLLGTCTTRCEAFADQFEPLVSSILQNYSSSWPPPTGTNVKLGLNLYKVSDIDMSAGVLHMSVWVRMSWMDTRLRWDPAAWGGVDVVSMPGRPKAMSHFRGTEVWVPEVELVNGEESLYTLPDKDVMVYSDGSCFWSRPGILHSACTMEGLQNFPFDRLVCRLKFQGWTLDDRAQNLSFYDPPWATEKVPKVSFQEFHLNDVTTRRAVDLYACCPGGWPYLEFSMEITRSRFYYVLKVCLVNTLFTSLAFGVLFVPPSARFNRLGFSITLMLTLTAADIVQSSYLPTTDSVLWISAYIMLSWFAAFLTTAISFCTVIIYNTPEMQQDKRLGRWATMFERVVLHSSANEAMRSWVRRLRRARRGNSPRRARTSTASSATRCDAFPRAGGPPHTKGAAAMQEEGAADTPADPKCVYVVPASDVSPVHSRPSGRPSARAALTKAASTRASNRESNRESSFELTSCDEGSSTRLSRGGAPPGGLFKKRTSRLVQHDATVLKSILATDIDGVDAALVRRAFHLLDEDQRGFIEMPRMEVFLTHFGNSVDAAALLAIDNGDQMWDTAEFTQLCVELIDDLGAEWFERVLASIEDTRQSQHEQIKLLWHARAVAVDSWARLLLPCGYYLGCIVLFLVRLPDPPAVALVAAPE